MHTHLWVNVAKASIHEMLCIKCLAKRLGRPLNAGDFTDASINDPRHNDMSSDLVRALRS